MTLFGFIKKTTEMIEEKYGNNTLAQYGLRPRVICNDGFSVSIQGNHGTYCSPRKLSKIYSTLELGFPSDQVTKELMEYAENKSMPTETVYAYVPIRVIKDLLDTHGGINEEETFKHLNK